MPAAVDFSAIEELLWDAFDGDPGAGCRELRLSREEADLLRAACPAAGLFHAGQTDGDGKAWYDVDFCRGGMGEAR